MHKLSLGWLMGLTVVATQASDDTSPFGKVTKEELAATYYPLDSTAEAVFLRNNGKVHISYEENQGFRAYHIREVKIEIYRSAGFDWAEIVLPYYVKYKYKAEIIRDIEGFSFTLHADAIQKNGLEK